ncbi:MAG: NUDIX domain-containing protein [Ignavibacteria bacterium]
MGELIILNDAIELIDKYVPDPSIGLPDEVFYYVSRTTPLVNVDLLIKDENGRTLLAWRNDKHAGTGWHIPGGIVRFRETFETRIKKVAKTEIGTDLEFKKEPLALNEIINFKRKERSHFISVLFECFLSETFVIENKNLSPNDAGYLMWHDKCPDNLIKFHDIYRKYFNRQHQK